MYYEILVNGQTLGVYGHPRVNNMHLSVQVTSEGPEVFASGVCEEQDGLYMFNWVQQRVLASDIVTIRPTSSTVAAEPRNKYKMRKAEGEA